MTDGKVPAPGEAVAWAYGVDLVKGSEKFLLVTVALYASLDEDDRWTCWPSRATLAANIGVSRDRVKQLLRSLEAHGLLVREQRARASGASSSSRYVLPLGSGHPPGGERATPGGGERATPQCEPPSGTTTEPSPTDDPRLPSAVGRGRQRRAIRKDVAALAVRVMDYWTRRTGVNITGTDVGRAIVLRIHEDLDAGLALDPDVHKRIIDANLARPYWGAEKAAPNVLYGSSKAWNTAKARAQGPTTRNHDQDPTRRAASERDARRAAAAVEALRATETT